MRIDLDELETAVMFRPLPREKAQHLIAETRDHRARVAEMERALDVCRAELVAARAAVGEAWFAGGATLAEAIERKCRALEVDAAKAAAEVERFRRDNEMACENTPWLGCTCPGCETARARAVENSEESAIMPPRLEPGARVVWRGAEERAGTVEPSPFSPHHPGCVRVTPDDCPESSVYVEIDALRADEVVEGGEGVER